MAQGSSWLDGSRDIHMLQVIRHDIKMKMFGVGFQSATVHCVTVKVTWPILNLPPMLSNVAELQ